MEGEEFRWWENLGPRVRATAEKLKSQYGSCWTREYRSLLVHSYKGMIAAAEADLVDKYGLDYSALMTEDEREACGMVVCGF